MVDDVAEELRRQRRLVEALGAMSESLHRNNRVGMTDPHVPHEGAVVSLTVLPVLAALGWRVLQQDEAGADYIETYCEFKTRTIQADVALLGRDGLPRVLVEAKRPGDGKKPLLKDKHAIHQLLGYVHDACRAGFPLAAAVLTNGRDWLVWRLPERGLELKPSPIVNIANTGADQALWESLARDNLPLLVSRPGTERLPDDESVWKWEVKNEAFPETGVVINKATGEKTKVWVRAWKDETTGMAFAREKRVDPKGIEFVRDTCSKCGGREVRLGHNCSGELPASWKYQLA